MEWILIAGALCLSSHHEICINHTGDKTVPYSLVTPLRAPASWGTLGIAKYQGEEIAKELDEFPLPPGGSWTTTSSVVVTDPLAPYFATTQQYSTTDSYLDHLSTFAAGAHGHVLAVDPPSQPYGMTREEFGAFIESRVSAGIAHWMGNR